ncbi:unnamed protein product, partial [marine sediment metagenome]
QYKIQPLQSELKKVKDELAGIAIDRRGEGRMVRLDGIIGEAVVEWHRKITVDPEKAAKLKKTLGKKDFNLFFEERSEYKPTKNLNLLIKARDKGAKMKKAEVFNTLVIDEKGPYVKIKEKAKRKRAKGAERK